MLKACPRCKELVLDTSGECKKCQKRFAPDRLPPLNRFEASKILMDRQKERAQLKGASPAAKGSGRAWLRYPLQGIGWLLGALAGFFLLHLVVMDLAGDARVTAGVAALALTTGFLASLALDRAAVPAAATGGRMAELDHAIRVLEDEIERMKPGK